MPVKRTNLTPLAAIAAAIAAGGASAGAAGALASASPARSDATAAAASATATLRSGTVAGLLRAGRLSFTFAPAGGTCPPGQSDGNYCVGASGTVLFTLTLDPRGGKPVRAAKARVEVGSAPSVAIAAKLDKSAIAALRSVARHGKSLRATVSAEAVLSATSYYTATGSVRIP
jgi:hypothetical protein